ERLNSFSNSSFSDSLNMMGTADSWGIALKPQTLYLYIVGKLMPSCTSQLIQLISVAFSHRIDKICDRRQERGA
ncbi:MAG TPA: hypothetical protein V6D19_15655, partial [Stenomitos sp.]